MLFYSKEPINLKSQNPCPQKQTTLNSAVSGTSPKGFANVKILF